MVLIRDVSTLSPLMIISTLCMFATIATVLYFSGVKVLSGDIAPGVTYIINKDTFLVFLGMGSFLFGKIGIVVPIRDIMNKKSEFTGCLYASLWSIFGIFAVFGFTGYLAYGADPKMKSGGGMVTLMLNQENMIVQLVEFLFMLSLIPSFALMIYVPIKIIEKAMFGGWERSGKRTWLKNFERLLFVALICYIAIATSKTFDKVMAVFGSLFGGPTTFIWPAIFHLILFNNDLKGKLMNCLLILFGTAASGFTLYMTVKKLVGA